ncbi:hypothetical protein JXB27_02510 [Candidatus Woesearchaeota archaeon]|nr:hypothetical protein [Candidatus Woesearchaeota archaeon]
MEDNVTSKVEKIRKVVVEINKIKGKLKGYVCEGARKKDIMNKISRIHGTLAEKILPLFTTEDIRKAIETSAVELRAFLSEEEPKLLSLIQVKKEKIMLAEKICSQYSVLLEKIEKIGSEQVASIAQNLLLGKEIEKAMFLNKTEFVERELNKIEERRQKNKTEQEMMIGTINSMKRLKTDAQLLRKDLSEIAGKIDAINKKALKITNSFELRREDREKDINMRGLRPAWQNI